MPAPILRLFKAAPSGRLSCPLPPPSIRHKISVITQATVQNHLPYLTENIFPEEGLDHSNIIKLNSSFNRLIPSQKTILNLSNIFVNSYETPLRYLKADCLGSAGFAHAALCGRKHVLCALAHGHEQPFTHPRSISFFFQPDPIDV